MVKIDIEFGFCLCLFLLPPLRPFCLPSLWLRSLVPGPWRACPVVGCLLRWRLCLQRLRLRCWWVALAALMRQLGRRSPLLGSSRWPRGRSALAGPRLPGGLLLWWLRVGPLVACGCRSLVARVRGWSRLVVRPRRGRPVAGLAVSLALGSGLASLVCLPPGVSCPSGWGLFPVPGCPGWFGCSVALAGLPGAVPASAPVAVQLSLF